MLWNVVSVSAMLALAFLLKYSGLSSVAYYEGTVYTAQDVRLTSTHDSKTISSLTHIRYIMPLSGCGVGQW